MENNMENNITALPAGWVAKTTRTAEAYTSHGEGFIQTVVYRQVIGLRGPDIVVGGHYGPHVIQKKVNEEEMAVAESIRLAELVDPDLVRPSPEWHQVRKDMIREEFTTMYYNVKEFTNLPDDVTESHWDK